MLNRFILDGDSFNDIDKRRALRRKLARKMLLESNFTKFTKVFMSIVICLIVLYFIQHDLLYGHFVHFTPHG